MSVLYAFESQDSMAQFSVGIASLPGVLLVFFFFTVSADWTALLVSVLIAAIFMLGLRASIVVTDTEVVIVKKWLFVRYKTYRAPTIDDVWFGGDWGLEEGAIGVVVKLGQNEIHVGTRSNMRKIHDALWPLCLSYKGKAR
jgi:hypothetical protein